MRFGDTVGKRIAALSKTDGPEIGDQWVFVAIDAETKLNFRRSTLEAPSSRTASKPHADYDRWPCSLRKKGIEGPGSKIDVADDGELFCSGVRRHQFGDEFTLEGNRSLDWPSRPEIV